MDRFGSRILALHARGRAVLLLGALLPLLWGADAAFGAGDPTTTEVRISTSADDAEERGDLSVKLSSSDLELTLEDGAPQIVGLRFHPLHVPAGARIASAWIQFRVNEGTSGQTDLRIGAEASPNAPPFVGLDENLRLRPTTGSFVSWQVPP